MYEEKSSKNAIEQYQKKVIALMAAIAIVFFNGSFEAYASEVTFSRKEIIDAVSKVYEDAGYTVQVNLLEGKEEYTKFEMDRLINSAKNSLESDNTQRLITLHGDCVGNMLKGSGISTMAMPYKLTCSATEYLVNSMASGANIMISCDTIVNAQSISFISVGEVTSRQYGAALNFISWSQTSGTAQITNGGKTVTLTVEGTLTTETELDPSIRVRLTKDHTITKNFDAR